MQSGVLAGYNVVDVKVTLYDGSYHEVDSSEMAFKIAGSMAFKEAMREADPVLDRADHEGGTVTTPDDYHGRCHWRPQLPPRSDPVDGACRGRTADHSACVPLSEMFGYATEPPFQNAGARSATPWSPATSLKFRRTSRKRSSRQEARKTNFDISVQTDL